MYRASIARPLAAIFTTLSLLSAGLAPVVANAQANICIAADQACNTPDSVATHHPCACAITGVYITGVCVAHNDCKAITYWTGAGVGSVPVDPNTLAPLSEGITASPISGMSNTFLSNTLGMTTIENAGATGGLLGGLTTDNLLKYGMIGMMGMSMLSSLFGGGSGSSNNNTGGTTPSYGCTTQYYYTSNVNALTDPCAQYNPNAGNVSGGGGGTTPQTDNSIADLLRNLGNNGSTNPNININVPSSTTSLADLLNQNNSSNNCPNVQLTPSCGVGMVPHDNGFDSHGCRLGATCVSDLSSVLNPASTSSLSHLPIATIDNPFSQTNTNPSNIGTNPLDQMNTNTGTPNTTNLNTGTPNTTNLNTGTPTNTNSLSGGTQTNSTTGNTGNTGGGPDLGGGGSTGTPTPVPISQALTSTIYYNDTTSNSTPAPSQTPLNQPLSQQLPANGLHGDIRSFGKGVTIYATSRNGNTVVAGFYGSNSTAGRLCQSRPWSSNFLSYVIPSSFFDNLCTWAGYPTGVVQGGGVNTSGGVVRNTSVGAPTSVGNTQNINPQQAQAKIWARPPSVSIGGRTTIFWTSQNVSACTESSSDGNFSGSTTSGGASTVSLSGPVTFTINCRGVDGNTVSNSTTVTIGI